jgi:hypothetical protein
LQYDSKHCAECDIRLAGSPVLPVMLDVNGNTVDVPGLYRCAGCQQLMNRGIITSNINQEEAFDWLAGVYVPQVTTVLMMAATGLQPLPQAYRAILGRRVADAIDLAHELAELLGADGPEDPEAGPEDGPSPLEQAIRSIEIGPDMRATYACPGCRGRHDVERLFEIADDTAARPESDAA